MSHTKTKILYLTTSNVFHGTEKQLFSLVRNIDQNRYVPHVVILKDDGGILNHKLTDAGIPNTCLGMKQKWQIHKLFRLVSIARSFRPHILQSFLFFDNQVARIIGKCLSAPVVISGQRSVKKKRSMIRNLIDRLTAPCADHVVSNSHAGKQLACSRERIPATKVSVIPNGIDMPTQERNCSINRETLGISSETYVIGYIGSLEEHKGCRYLIEALTHLKSNHIHLLIFGTGSKQEELMEMVRRYRLDSIVHFLGYREDAAVCIHLLDCLILPSLREGMPNVVLEAMASKTPVIATAVGGTVELIDDGKTGYLIPSADPHALKEAIEKVRTLPEEKRRQITDAAYENVATSYTIENMVAAYEKLYTTFTKASS